MVALNTSRVATLNRMSSEPQSSSSDGNRSQLGAANTTKNASALERAIEATMFRGENNLLDIQALQEVATRFRGQPLSPDPIAHALVEATLRRRFDRVCCSADVWHVISAVISNSLWEDDYSRVRLESLWQRLGESLR